VNHTGSSGTSQVRVLDWGAGLPAAVAVRLLSVTGAKVFRVRDQGHQVFDDLYPALPWWYRDAELVDAEDAEGLLPGIDVCLLGGEEHPQGPPAAPVDPAELGLRHDRLVVVEMGAYVPGEQDQTAAVDLLVQARTGFVFEQFDGRPTHVAFAPALYGTGILAATGAWAGLVQRLRTGRGDLVRVSMQQALALFWPHLWLTATRPDPAFDAVPPRDVRHLIFRCADGGYLQIVLGVPRALARLHEVLGIAAPADSEDRGVPSLARGPSSYFADRDLLAPHIARWRRDDLVRALKAAGMPAEPVLFPGECFDDPQVVAAGLVERDGRGRRYAAAPVSLASHGVPAAAAPVQAAPGPAAARGAAGEGPLAGVTVLDIGNWVAGPFASKLLADYGADVISVDPPTGLSNLTGMRNTLTSNRGKRSIVLDIKTAEGRAALSRLAARADVFTHNFRVGVAERLGLGPRDMRTARPDLIYLHTTAYGQTGPKARDSGFDMVMQALCGHEIRAGGTGNEPVWYRSPFLDYATGALGAVGVLAALHQRAATGAAIDVHTSLLGAAMFVRGEFAVTEDGSARGTAILSQDRCGMRPEECLYRAADGWIAVAARGSAMRAALLDVLGISGTGPADPWGPAQQELIGAAVASFPAAEIVARLAGAGVWAARCRGDAFAGMLDDPAAWRAHLVIAAEDPRFGRVTGCYGPLLSFAGWSPDPGAFRPAPMAGEHTEQVLAEIGCAAPAQHAREAGRVTG
jgi:crotonobetainyl-CoA:carnitine CoA-transferase CaiB-like acyl-CoA transferase